MVDAAPTGPNFPTPKARGITAPIVVPFDAAPMGFMLSNPTCPDLVYVLAETPILEEMVYCASNGKEIHRRGQGTQRITGGCTFDHRHGYIHCATSKGVATFGVLSIPDPPSSVAGEVRATPVVVESRLYVATYDGRLVAIDAATNKELWSLEITPWGIEDKISGFVAGGSTHVVITDDDGVIYNIRDEGTAGKRVWFNADFRGTTKPAVAPDLGYVYVGDDSGSLHQLSLARGKASGSLKLGGRPAYAPAIDVAFLSVFEAGANLPQSGFLMPFSGASESITVGTNDRVRRECLPLPNGCENACGGQSDNGCWCDADCVATGDCCDNVCAVCGHC